MFNNQHNGSGVAVYLSSFNLHSEAALVEIRPATMERITRTCSLATSMSSLNEKLLSTNPKPKHSLAHSITLMNFSQYPHGWRYGWSGKNTCLPQTKLPSQNVYVHTPYEGGHETFDKHERRIKENVKTMSHSVEKASKFIC